MSTLPASVAIGPIRYAIANDEQAYNKAVSEELVDIYGRIDYGKAHIVLKPQQSIDHMRLSLLHEVMHGCWHITRQQHTKVTEEEAIAHIAASLLDTLRRNPDFTAFLLAEGDA